MLTRIGCSKPAERKWETVEDKKRTFKLPMKVHNEDNNINLDDIKIKRSFIPILKLKTEEYNNLDDPENPFSLNRERTSEKSLRSLQSRLPEREPDPVRNTSPNAATSDQPSGEENPFPLLLFFFVIFCTLFSFLIMFNFICLKFGVCIWKTNKPLLKGNYRG